MIIDNTILFNVCLQGQFSQNSSVDLDKILIPVANLCLQFSHQLTELD